MSSWGYKNIINSGGLSLTSLVDINYQWPFAKIPLIGTGLAAYGADRGGYRHIGQDLVSVDGDSAAVYSIAEGIVIQVATDIYTGSDGKTKGAGNFVCIRHDQAGVQDGYCSWYFHMQPHKNSVKQMLNTRIPVGTQIGNQGSTGNSTGQHLHLQITTSGFSDSITEANKNVIGKSDTIDPVWLLTNGKDNAENYDGAYQAANHSRTTTTASGTSISYGIQITDSYTSTGTSLNTSVGSSQLLSPSDDERKYGVSVFDTTQLLIRGTTAAGVDASTDACDALKKYSKYIYYYLNSSISVANIQTISMPWIRPGFNVWVDPLHVNGVQQIGDNQGGSYTVLSLSFGRSRKRFQAQGLAFGSLNTTNSDDVFVNTFDYTPENFSSHVLKTAADFDSLKKRTDSEYINESGYQPLQKATEDPYLQFLYNTDSSAVGEVSGTTSTTTTATTYTETLDSGGVLLKGDRVLAKGTAYGSSSGSAPYQTVSGVTGNITAVSTEDSSYPYYFNEIGWMAKSSLTFFSRKVADKTTSASYSSPALTSSYGSISEIQKLLTAKYTNAPEVVKNRITKHKKLIIDAEAYLVSKYVVE